MLTLNDGRTELWQWDTGRILSVDTDCSQVHFSNKVFGRSIDVDAVDGVAIIPDVLLQTDNDLNVWAFVGTAENGYTKISKTFTVNRRNKPADYVFTPVDQKTLDDLQSQIGDLADLTTEAKDTLVAAINEAARTGGGSTVELDTTLSEAGKAADAAAVGDRLSALSEEKVSLPKDENGNILTPTEGQTLLFKADGTTYYGTPTTSGGTTTETVEGGIVYAPYRWDKLDGTSRGWIAGNDISLETYLSNRRTDVAFFDMPYLFNNQVEGNVLGDIFNALVGRSNYVSMHYKALKPGEYRYHVPVSMFNGVVSNITCKIIKCSYNNVGDFFNAIINDGYNAYTVSDISPVTLASETETGWAGGKGNTYGLAQYSFTVQEGEYAFLTCISLLSDATPTGDNIATNEMYKHYHLAMNTIIDEPLTYTDTETIKFGTITVENGDSSNGSDSGGTGENTGSSSGGTTTTSKSAYPMNTYGKTVVVGGDSGTSYGADSIVEYVKKYCGATVSVRSVAGSKFTGTENGGGLWFVNQYHNVGYPNVVCLCWGGNFDASVGSVTADYMEDGTTTPTTTLGALRYIVEDIRKVSPNTLILGWIPYQMNLDNSWESRKTVYDQIREGYKLLAIPIIDAFYESGIVPRDMMSFDEGGIGGDQGHPSGYGQERIAKLIANTIIRYA